MLNSMDITRKWCGRWINDGRCIGSFERLEQPSPIFRKEFQLNALPGRAELFLCGLGWHILYVNGQKADDRVMAPVVTQYTGHVSYIAYDVTKLLRAGDNAVAVVLGNGWFNCETDTTWYFRYAPWRDAPKMLADLVVDGNTLIQSDTTWKYHTGPITFDELRNGEYYDARLEMPGFAEAGFDDSDWHDALQTVPPPGVVSLEECHPCKVIERIQPVAKYDFKTRILYDFGANLSGHCRIKVRGKAGDNIHLHYTEKIDPVSKARNRAEIDCYVTSGFFQRDIYTLKGDADGEVWEPSFTYHGFRYVEILWNGTPEFLEIEACFVHSAFPETGEIETSDVMLNQLLDNARRSFRCNYVGIPTDCPHREKNGWTGDAQIVSETGLWNFACQREMRHFLKMFLDTQRASGQFPGIAPTGGWGYNWGAGIAWDALLLEYPWQIYRFTGESAPMREVYDAARRYLDFLHGMENARLITYGLGDWMHVDSRRAVSNVVFHTAYYCHLHRLMSKFAQILGFPDEAQNYAAFAGEIRTAWNQNFYHGSGAVAQNETTALALPLYFDLAEASERPVIAKQLVQAVRAMNHKADFGFFGAKFVPRALAETGYAEDAFKLYRQEEYPGWMWTVRQGGTTLWENWSGQYSQNHYAFSDVSAWMYQYLAGMVPDENVPGFRHFTFKPHFVGSVNRVKASHTSPYGKISVEWSRGAKSIQCTFVIPDGSAADIVLPGQTIANAHGVVTLEVK